MNAGMPILVRLFEKKSRLRKQLIGILKKCKNILCSSDSLLHIQVKLAPLIPGFCAK